MSQKEKYKDVALKILSPIKSADNIHEEDIIFNSQRSLAGQKLPEYFLIYFLLSDLLGFKNLGQFEKIAWSFPVEYKGKFFLIEYRKFGVGVFVKDRLNDEKDAEEITKKINGAVKSVRQFYDLIAEDAVNNSKFNIINNNQDLYQRFEYLLKLYKKEYRKFIKNKDNVKIKENVNKYGKSTTCTNIGLKYYQKSNWIAISCIEAFFSWTEHLFIHLAVIDQNLSNGQEVSNLIEAEWRVKFKAAIKDNSKPTIKFYDELLIVRQQLRNFVAHGAFGKNGNAFRFHSGTGSVPVLMNHKRQKNRFSLEGNLSFKEEEVIKLIEDFIIHIWESDLNPSLYYTQKCGLPTILTYAADGTYSTMTININIMKEFVNKLVHEMDNSSNMDW